MVLYKKVALPKPFSFKCRHCEREIQIVEIEARYSLPDDDYDPNSGYGLAKPEPEPVKLVPAYTCPLCNDWFTMQQEYREQFMQYMTWKSP